MFRINDVFKLNDKKYRVIADLPEEIVWIAIEDIDGFPSIESKNFLRTLIDSEQLTRTSDPYEQLYFALPEADSIAQRKRDYNYELILPIVSDPLCFLPEVRSKKITTIVNEKKSTKQTLYRLLRRYWQRGQTPNALLPDYVNSGAKGKKRIAADKKLGRPRVFTPGVGSIIDEQVEKLFRAAIDRHLLTEKKHNLRYAHRRFKSVYETYFPDVPECEIPTIWQFNHFYKREYGQAEKIQARASTIEYKKDLRPLHGTANSNLLGPGSRFEIDATIADIYLISDSDRRNIVGRPIVYIVIDVFSRMIVGLYIGFENPSYVAAMQALSMAMSSKVDYCKKIGIEITEDEWPSSGLPEAILADRGELLGHQIEALERNFSVRIENSPPYRGDAKGVVERYFRTLQADFKPFAPGVVTSNRIKKAGGKDYRLEAELTIRDFTEMMLLSIRYHNTFHVMKKYDRSIDMPADLPMTPIALWNWGLQHRTGRLRSVPVDALRVSLFPRVRATLSELGLSVFGVYYTSKEILKRGWMHRGKNVTRPDSLEVAYDPAIADVVYLIPNKSSTEYWVCNLADRSREFIGSSFWDVWQIKNEQKTAIASAQLTAEQKKRQLDEQIEATIKKAKLQAGDVSDVPNKERISTIRPSRQKERAQERAKAERVVNPFINDEPAKVVSITKQQNDGAYPDYIGEFFEDE